MSNGDYLFHLLHFFFDRHSFFFSQRTTKLGVVPTRKSPDGPEVSTQAENPVALTHSSQTVTAWCSGRVMELDRDGAS